MDAPKTSLEAKTAKCDDSELETWTEWNERVKTQCFSPITGFERFVNSVESFVKDSDMLKRYVITAAHRRHLPHFQSLNYYIRDGLHGGLFGGWCDPAAVDWFFKDREAVIFMEAYFLFIQALGANQADVFPIIFDYAYEKLYCRSCGEAEGNMVTYEWCDCDDLHEEYTYINRDNLFPYRRYSICLLCRYQRDCDDGIMYDEDENHKNLRTQELCKHDGLRPPRRNLKRK